MNYEFITIATRKVQLLLCKAKGYEPSTLPLRIIRDIHLPLKVSDTRVMMAVATDKIFANISPLKSEKDWPVWKFQVMHALKAAEYWDFVTGDTDTGSQGYESKKQKAFSSVLQCIGQKNIPAVMNCADPKELWDTLCQ